MFAVLAFLAAAAVPAPNPITLDVCRYALAQATLPEAVPFADAVEGYITASRMDADQANTQRTICVLYLAGAQDLLALQAPRT
jgi:hypothetical protein